MGTIKIELDIPNFDKELELKVVLNKDGVQSGTPLIEKIVQPNQAMQIPVNDAGTAWKQSPSIPSPNQAAPQTISSSKSNHGIPSSMMGNF